MDTTIKLEAKTRQGRGTSESRRLRNGGQIPAVMYGLDEGTATFSVSEREFRQILRHGVRIVNIELEGKSDQAMIRDIQYDQMGDNITHVDFIRVKAGQKIHTSVSIELVGTPKGIAAGGVLEQVLREIEVECVPSAIPSGLKCHVNHLGIDESILVKDLDMPEGVVPLEDMEAVVAQVFVRVEKEEEGTEEAGEFKLPEVIGAKDEEETEGEEEK